MILYKLINKFNFIYIPNKTFLPTLVPNRLSTNSVISNGVRRKHSYIPPQHNQNNKFWGVACNHNQPSFLFRWWFNDSFAVCYARNRSIRSFCLYLLFIDRIVAERPSPIKMYYYSFTEKKSPQWKHFKLVCVLV